MKIFKFIWKYNLFLILFLILIIIEPIYKLLKINEDVYTPMRCQFLEDDYNKLLEFSEINLIYESDYLNTYIIYKDIYDYMNEITIRGGLDEGLNNNPVIYDNTLVGFVSKVNKTSSIVKLITSNDSKVSVKINNEIGVLEYKDNELIVSNISNYSNINIDDNIYTSGLGNTKENIYIGIVKDISLDKKGIEKVIKVNYKLNIKDINYVNILKENL